MHGRRREAISFGASLCLRQPACWHSEALPSFQIASDTPWHTPFHHTFVILLHTFIPFLLRLHNREDVPLPRGHNLDCTKQVFRFLSWYHLPCICNSLELEPVIVHGICYILAWSPSIVHGICYILAWSPSILHGICYILAWSPSILHGICYILACFFQFAWYLLPVGMVTFHFAWYLPHFAMFAFHFAWYLPHFGTSTSHLHDICYMLVLQTFMSCGFL